MMRAVVCDVGGVVSTVDSDALVARWGDRLGTDMSGIFAAMFGGNDDGVLVGKIPVEEWWLTVAGRLGLDRASLVTFRSDYERYLRFDAELLGFLEGLRPTFRTAFLSNAWADLRELLVRHGVLASVDELICSAEVGVAKPDAHIFEIALARLEVGPEETVFIDDWPENVDAARALGMTGIVHRTARETITDLAPLLRARPGRIPHPRTPPE